MEHLPAFITASTVGALIAVGNFLLALTGPAAVLSPKRRIAANIKQIFQICEHSEKDIAKQRLQEKADALILRYAALTLIRYSPWELAAIIFFYATLIGLFAAYFFIGTFRHRLNGLNDLLVFGIIILVPLLINMIPLFLRRRLQVNRQLFILLDAPPIDHFREQVRRLKWRYYFSRKPADKLYKLMLALQKKAASESTNNTPKQPQVDYLDDAIAAILVKRRRHDRPQRRTLRKTPR
jgi:hypothetical protein